MVNSKNILLSIIIPLYNKQEDIFNTLQELVKIDSSDIEIIVIDDNSDDSSYKYALSLKDPRMKLYKNMHNLGVSATRNRAIELARGQFISFVDADDKIFIETFVSLIDNHLRKNMNIDLFIFKFISENKELTNESLFKLTNNYGEVDKVIFLNHLLKINFQPEQCWFYLINRNLINQYKVKFINNVIIAEDQEFSAKILCYANSIYLFNELVYQYNERANSLKKVKNYLATISLFNVISSLSNFSERYSIESPEKRFLNKRISEILPALIARIIDSDVEEQNLINTKIDINISELIQNANQYIQSMIKHLNYKYIYLYCVGPTGIATLRILDNLKYNVSCFIDDNPLLNNKLVDTINIRNLDIHFMNQIDKSESLFLICNPKKDIYTAIRDKLVLMGIEQSKICHTFFNQKKLTINFLTTQKDIECSEIL